MLAIPSCLLPFLFLAHFSGASSAYFNKVQREPASCTADAKKEWSYRGDNGPQHWGEIYDACNGNNQSPIAIYTSKAVQSNLPKLEMKNYDVPITSATVLNDGHTIKVTPDDGVQRTAEAESSTYRLLQIHFHWGERPNNGSEHMVDDIKASLEMHLVHQDENGNKAVIAVGFIQPMKEESEEEGENKELQKIVDVFPQVRFKDESTQLGAAPILNGLVSANPATYYGYDGSLTTPGCSEGVKWFLLPKCLSVCRSQMNAFRNLYSATEEDATEDCRLVDNYRPLQPVNNRTVYRSQ